MRTNISLVAGILLATDVMLIAAHILLATTGIVQNDNVKIVAQHGFAETFQYLKAFWVLLMFLWIIRLTREWSHLAWAVVFTYLGVDDLLGLHGHIATTLTIRYTFPEVLGLRTEDIGKLAAYAVPGITLFALVTFAYVLGSRTFRRYSESLTLLSLLLVIFGVAIDAIHTMFRNSIANRPLALVEEGGEMIVLSIICAYTFSLISHMETIESNNDYPDYMDAWSETRQEPEAIEVP